MIYVLVLLWASTIAAVVLVLWLIRELTTPNEWASIDEHHAVTEALRGGQR